MFSFYKKSLPQNRLTRVSMYVIQALVLVVALIIAVLVSVGKYVAYIDNMPHEDESIAVGTEEVGIPQFPVGVDPQNKEIAENPSAELFFEEYLVDENKVLSAHTSFFRKFLGELALNGWYQNLASVSSRMLVIQSGERKEQIATNFKKILKWTDAEKEEFLTRVTEGTVGIEEGVFFPDTYTVSRTATPEDVAELVLERFASEVLAHYGAEVDTIVPLEQALIVASLLEREAYDFEDMRHISGVIWNRLFTDMRLQIDATLQYVKGSKPHQPWWPKVIPDDKYLVSAFNTYRHEGLPPTAIANPSLEAILAALNPSETDCMFYFHDTDGGFHCTVTYEEHVAELKKYYGRGK